MRLEFIYLFCIFMASRVNTEDIIITTINYKNSTTTPASTLESFPNPSTNSTKEDDQLISDEYPPWDTPKTTPYSTSNVGIPQDSKTNQKFDHKPLAVHFVQKFSDWARPIYEKWNRFKNFLAYPDHPNYSGGQYYNPQDVWDKWQEKGHHFLTGINGAVYGLAPSQNHDYPFAYRKLESPDKSVRKQKYNLN